MYQRVQFPALSPASRRIACRSGSNANRIRSSVRPAEPGRSSFMFLWRDAVTVSTSGRPSCGPSSRILRSLHIPVSENYCPTKRPRPQSVQFPRSTYHNLRPLKFYLQVLQDWKSAHDVRYLISTRGCKGGRYWHQLLFSFVSVEHRRFLRRICRLLMLLAISTRRCPYAINYCSRIGRVSETSTSELAQEHGRSMEAEVRDILTRAVIRPHIGLALAQAAREVGGVEELQILERKDN